MGTKELTSSEVKLIEMERDRQESKVLDQTAELVEVMALHHNEDGTISDSIMGQINAFSPTNIEEDEDEQMAIRPQIMVKSSEPTPTAPTNEKMVFNVNLGGGAQQAAAQTTPDTPENRKKYITIAVIALVLIVIALLAFKFLKK